MTTLTKTRIDIADRHTSLYFFKKKVGDPDPLPMGGSQAYQDLYTKIATAHRMQYQKLTGKAGTVLDKLLPLTPDDPDKPLKYWIRYLGRGPAPDDAWDEAIPLLATPDHRLEIQRPANFPAKTRLSPIPQIILYPFGWSTWISCLITGEHTLSDLASLVAQIFQQKTLNVSGAVKPFTLSDYFDLVAKGIRTDAFGGTLTKDRKEADPAIVVTVLEKNSGAPSLGGIGATEEQQLQSLVRPRGPAVTGLPKEMVFRYPGKAIPDLNYLLSGGMGRFIWKEELLDPVGTNQMKLECYHHNSFRSLLQAWHFYGLLEYSSSDGLLQRCSLAKAQAAKTGVQTPDDSILVLLMNAFHRLDNFRYHNASLRAFLDMDDVKKQIAASRQEAVSAGLLAAHLGPAPTNIP